MKILVLDLDETLVYSTLTAESSNAIALTAEGAPYYTMLRPGLHAFLEHVSRSFECVIWSTGKQAYVESVWAYLGVPGFRLMGREFCKRIEAHEGEEPYEKPLRNLTEDLRQIVIVDNSPAIFNKYPLNGILCRTWRGDMSDRELSHLRVYLDWLRIQESMQRDHQSWRLETLCMRSK